jgi:SAM-dependent methyltransferase
VPDYDALAWFYDRYWRGDPQRLALDAFERLVAPALGGRRRVLDLCCGAGHLDALLVARGYTVTGVDESAPMLDAARRNVPGARFEHADVRHYVPPPCSCEAVIATFDSLNHVLEFADLGPIFDRAREALTPGGILFFDLLDESAYRTLWSRWGHDVAEDHALIVRGAYDAAEGAARVAITMFRRRNGTWLRDDAMVRECYHPPDRVAAALAGAGFDPVDLVPAASLGQAGDLALGRLYVVARTSVSREAP